MLHIDAAEVIHRPIDDVWEFSFDVHNEHHWLTNVVERRLITPEPLRVGSRIHAVDRILGHHVTSVHEITELDPPHRWVGRVIEGSPRYGFTATYEERGQATRVTLCLDVDIPGGRAGRLVQQFLRRPLGRRLRDDLDRLKAVLEATT